MIRGCVVLDGYINIFEIVNCDQEKKRAGGLSGRNVSGWSEPSPFFGWWKSIMFKLQIPSIRWKCDFWRNQHNKRIIRGNRSRVSIVQTKGIRNTLAYSSTWEIAPRLATSPNPGFYLIGMIYSLSLDRKCLKIKISIRYKNVCWAASNLRRSVDIVLMSSMPVKGWKWLIH